MSVISKALEKNRREAAEREPGAPATPASIVVGGGGPSRGGEPGSFPRAGRIRAGAGAGVWGRGDSRGGARDGGRGGGRFGAAGGVRGEGAFSLVDALPGVVGGRGALPILMGVLAIAGVVAGFMMGRDGRDLRRGGEVDGRGSGRLGAGQVAAAGNQAGGAGAGVGGEAGAAANAAAAPAAESTPAPRETPLTVRVEVSVAPQSGQLMAAPAAVSAYEALPPDPRPLPPLESEATDESIPTVRDESQADRDAESAPAPVRRARRPAAAPEPTPARASEIAQNYKLEGVFYSEGNSSAIINGEIVNEGRQIDELKIVKINKTSVMVESGGRQFELK